MPTSQPLRRQFHLRAPDDLAEAISARAAEMGIDVNEWMRRAATYALELGKAYPNPPKLELPWSALL